MGECIVGEVVVVDFFLVFDYDFDVDGWVFVEGAQRVDVGEYVGL